MEQKKFDSRVGTVRTVVIQSGLVRLIKDNDSLCMTFEEAASAVDTLLQAMTYINEQHAKAQEGIPGAVDGLKKSNQEAQEVQGRFQDVVKDL